MKLYVLFIFIWSWMSSPILCNQSCSREDSRLVRDYFTQALGPIYEKNRLAIPSECVFSPVRDIFYQQELNKTKITDDEWLCKSCNKTFHSEYYLDIHFSNRHNDTLIKNEQSVCLSDYCSIFRCNLLKRTKKSIRARNSLARSPDGTSEKSNTIINEQQLTILRIRCASVINQCIPQNMNYDTRVRIQHEMYTEVCAYLTSKKYLELPTYCRPLIGFTTIFYLTILIGACLIGIRVVSYSKWKWNSMDEDESEKHLSDETISTATALLSTTPSSGIIHSSKNPTSTIRHRVRFKSFEDRQTFQHELM